MELFGSAAITVPATLGPAPALAVAQETLRSLALRHCSSRAAVRYFCLSVA